MKRIIAMLLAVTMIAGMLSGCSVGSEGGSADDQKKTSDESVPEEKEQETENVETEVSTEKAVESANIEDAIAIVEAAAAKGVTLKMAWVTPEVNSNTSAALALSLEKVAKEYGMEYSTSCYDGVATTGISQIENLVESGVQLILLTPSGTGEEFKDAVAYAKEAGCYVMCHDTEVEGVDSNYLVNNFDLGYAMGTAASNWINEKLGGSCEYAVLGAPAYITMVERASGFTSAVQELAPEAVCVSEGLSAISTSEGMEMTENILQAHPDVKVMFVIGDGIALGAMEAVQASGADTEDFGIFSADATQEACEVIKADGVIRTSVSLGSFDDMARVEIGTLLKLYAGEKVEYYVYKDTYPIDSSNVDEYIAEMYN